MRRLAYFIMLVTFIPLCAGAQDAPSSPGGLSRLPIAGGQPEEVKQLAELFRSGAVEESDAAARRMIEIAGELAQSKKQVEAVNIARDLFLSSAPNDVRQSAFGILNKHASTYLAPHVNEVKVLVPNVSCYGRFHDSLKKSVRDEFDWVYSVGIRNTYRVRPMEGQLTIGTVAELTFTIDSTKKPRELASALKKSQYDGIEGWTMFVERPIASLAE